VRAFVDFAIERLTNNATYVLSRSELVSAARRGAAQAAA
jgi:hypothetical protein